jgi:glyoxylase I family protein
MVDAAVDYKAKREQLARTYIKPKADRPATTARGVHHLALICSDIERTIKFYTEVLGFPLVELFENRDLPSSTHFFFDIGTGNMLAFFDFPEDPMPATRESIGGMHHIAIAVHPEHFDHIRAKLDQLGIQYFGPDRVENSLYFHDPDGALIEVTRDPLEEMEGKPLGG